MGVKNKQNQQKVECHLETRDPFPVIVLGVDLIYKTFYKLYFGHLLKFAETDSTKRALCLHKLKPSTLSKTPDQRLNDRFETVLTLSHPNKTLKHQNYKPYKIPF